MVKERLIGSYSPSKSSSKGSVALCQEEEKIFTNARMVAGKDDTLNPMKVERFIMAMSTERPYREVKQKIIGGAQTMVGRIFRDRDAQNLRRIKQRKGHCFIQASSDDEDDKDDDFIPPYTLQDFRTQVYSPQQNAPVEACVPICAILCEK